MTKWSWKITRLAGIDIYVHATFFILLIWFGASFWVSGGTVSAVVSGMGFILVLFACVVLHEFGHALTARRYGIATKHITLLPIGGVAALERMPDDPREEINVALAGPAVNMAIAFVLWVWLSFTSSPVQLGQLSLIEGSFLQKLLVVNLMLAIFNLVPAFPMDGGRILRALLAIRMDHNMATQVAARVGQGLALWLGFIGLLYNPFLVIIAMFVWFGAAAEAGMEQIKTTLSDATLGQAMLTDFQTLSPNDALSHAIELTLAGSQKEFPVLQGESMMGVLTQDDLLKGLHERGELALVGHCMQTEVQSADIHEPLVEVMKRLQTCQCPLISVTEAGKPIGIVNLENITELIKIQAALHDSHGQTRFGA